MENKRTCFTACFIFLTLEIIIKLSFCPLSFKNEQSKSAHSFKIISPIIKHLQ